MIRWLRKVLGLCEHKWKIIDTIRVRDYRSDQVVGYEKILQCVNCGNLKHNKFY